MRNTHTHTDSQFEHNSEMLLDFILPFNVLASGWEWSTTVRPTIAPTTCLWAVSCLHGFRPLSIDTTGPGAAGWNYTNISSEYYHHLWRVVHQAMLEHVCFFYLPSVPMTVSVTTLSTTTGQPCLSYQGFSTPWTSSATLTLDQDTVCVPL